MNFPEYEDLINKTERLLKIFNDKKAREPFEIGKWPRKVMLGHLIDSASNNHTRFVEAQLKDNLVFAGYDQDGWVKAQAYESANWESLIAFWAMFNRHIIHVISNIPNDKLSAPIRKHNFDVICFNKPEKDQPVTLMYLIKDYFAHMEHHLDQIFE